MAVFNSFTFDGNNSLDYGIYITGEAVYNAPERAVEMVNIPGKNGALALDQGRFENIEVTYPAGCFADNQADFADKVMKFRNALASRYTYKRLTDEYHPDEYRLGLYKSGLDVDAVRYGTAGEFNIVFDCKPQRFLVDGDRAISPTDWSDVQTESGELVTIESNGSLAVKSLEVSLSPIQEGSGEPSPTNIRPISGRTEVDTIVSPTTEAEDGSTYTTALGRTVYGGTLDVVSGVLTVDRATVDLGTLNWQKWSNPQKGFYASVRGASGRNALGVCSQYKRSVYSSVVTGGADGAFAMASTTKMIYLYDSQYQSSDVATFKTAMSGVQLCYELATPQTYQLTPQQISLLVGENHVWSDGEITVEYGVRPYYNPTPFASKPLIKVTGTGTLGIGEYILTITGTASQTLYIDCETMEIYTIEGTVPTGASSLVSINRNDFPVLKPGINNISVGSGITAVTITPRWWRI